MTGWMFAGTLYPCEVSQSVNAFGSWAASWTVSYGPTTSWLMIVTPPLPVAVPVLAAPPQPPQSPVPLLKHHGVGLSTVTWVIWSSSWNKASDERPTPTCPLMGNTHANDSGAPEYSI